MRRILLGILATAAILLATVLEMYLWDSALSVRYIFIHVLLALTAVKLEFGILPAENSELLQVFYLFYLIKDAFTVGLYFLGGLLLYRISSNV